MRSMTGEVASTAATALIRRALRATFFRQRGRREDTRHCEERSDEAIHLTAAMDCRVAALLAMTMQRGLLPLA